jgi:translation initiation factor IF-1
MTVPTKSPAAFPGDVTVAHVIEGTVEEVLPQGLYRVKTKEGATVKVSLSGIAKQTLVRVIPGDRILVEVSPLDPGRGRIKDRLQ